MRVQHAQIFCDARKRDGTAMVNQKCIFPRGVTVVSDNSILKLQEMRFAEARRYFLMWIQENVKGKILAVDHSGKAHAKMSAHGRLWRPWDLKVRVCFVRAGGGDD